MTEAIINFLREKIDPDFIILFGSQATGATHPESDVDVAFYKSGVKLDSYEIFLLAGELESLLKIKVDLIDLNFASTVFRAEVFASGHPIYTKSEDVLDEFRTRSYSMYARFNQERSGIIKNILETGRVYDF